MDNVEISGNTSGNYGVIRPNSNEACVVVSGSPKICDNWDSSGESGGVQLNICENTALDVGTKIKVAEEGLNADAEIGVYATTNYNAGNTFARTATTPSTDYANLSCFKNDKNSRLTGYAVSEDRVIWSSVEPLTITKKLPSAPLQDTWFTVQLTNGTTGATYRQQIKVAAGQTTGSATVVLQSGISYTIKDVADQSSWRYAHSSSAYSGYATTEWTAASSGTIGTVKVEGYSATRTLTLTCAAASDTSDAYVSETKSVENTITVPSN